MSECQPKTFVQCTFSSKIFSLMSSFRLNRTHHVTFHDRVARHPRISTKSASESSKYRRFTIESGLQVA